MRPLWRKKPKLSATGYGDAWEEYVSLLSASGVHSDSVLIHVCLWTGSVYVRAEIHRKFPSISTQKSFGWPSLATPRAQKCSGQHKPSSSNFILKVL